jgi:GTPase SAR1 family protein
MSSHTPIEAFLFLVQETVALAKNQNSLNEALCGYLEEFRGSRLVPICQREKLARKTPFTLCLVGLTNAGKSTLIEALLGAAVAPKKNGPATAVPVEYSYSSAWTLAVHYHNASMLPVHQCFTEPATLASEVTRHVIDQIPQEASKIAAVCVKGPMELLKNNLVLADPPGIGAAILEPTAESDDKLPATGWIRDSGRAFLCVAAGVSWKVSPEEADFYRSLRHICSNIIVTKWEDSDEAQEEWKAAFGKLFPGADFDFVNARRGVNVQQLRLIIEAQSSQERRILQTRRELLKAYTDLKRHFDQVYRREIPWRPDSLERFLCTCTPHAELHSISSELKKHG